MILGPDENTVVGIGKKYCESTANIKSIKTGSMSDELAQEKGNQPLIGPQQSRGVKLPNKIPS